jgi:uroporphyrinogen decarboxylase
MPDLVVPLRNPAPDCERFIRVLMGEENAERPPLIEYIVDDAVRQPITTELLGREWVGHGPDRASQAAHWDNFIEFWYRMGYDFVRLEIGFDFLRRQIAGEDPTKLGSRRGWADEHRGTIACWADFENYPWPDIEDFDFFPLEYVATHLPEGMGFITNHAGGPFEIVSQVLSLEGLCVALYDAPDLVDAVCARVGELMESFSRHILDLPNLIALFQGDDMGFRSATLVSPDVLRRLFLPWHARFARIAHDKGIPYFLHSCGDVSAIMEDLISVVGIDGKHSFEDAILPAPEFQARYGDRIATLGGVDLNPLAAASPQRVRAYTRSLISACAPRGRFAIGSGNSIPSYIPVENYLTMLDTALTYEAGGNPSR